MPGLTEELLDTIESLDPSEQQLLLQKLQSYCGEYHCAHSQVVSAGGQGEQGNQDLGKGDRLFVYCYYLNRPEGIEATPGICGGEPRIVRTRIPVWVLERMRQLGVSEADILRSFPTLRAEDLVHAWTFVSLHREEIEQQIRANEEE